MLIQENIDLTKLNTMALPSVARWYCKIQSPSQLQQAVVWAKTQKVVWAVLGGGSNSLLPEYFNGLLIHLCDNGWEEVKLSENHVWVRVAAGQNWHDFVSSCVAKGWFGLENLALIPGSVGAAPIQNIGAYGVEVEAYIDEVSWYDFSAEKTRVISHSECQFAYRDSAFKRGLLGRGVITQVLFKLFRHFQPVLDYPALAAALNYKESLSAQNVFNAVCEIRQSKLPDPAQLPNSGSFFKNPIISQSQFTFLKNAFPTIPSFATTQANSVKIPAAWLIEQAGWKGREWQGVRVHDQHALVLVNPLGKSLQQVLLLAERIASDVQAQFGISLEREPQVLNSTSAI